MNFWSRRVAFRTLTPGYVESFGSGGLRTRFNQATCHSVGALQSIHHDSLALRRYHLNFGHYQACRPGLHSDTSSSEGRSTWHPRSAFSSYSGLLLWHRTDANRQTDSVVWDSHDLEQNEGRGHGFAHSSSISEVLALASPLPQLL